MNAYHIFPLMIFSMEDKPSLTGMQFKMGWREPDIASAVMATLPWQEPWSVGKEDLSRWLKGLYTDGFRQLCSYSSLPLDVAIGVRITPGSARTPAALKEKCSDSTLSSGEMTNPTG